MSKRTQARTLAHKRTPSPPPGPVGRLRGSEQQAELRKRYNEAVYFDRMMRCRGRACNNEGLIMTFREPAFHAQLIFDAAMRGQWP